MWETEATAMPFILSQINMRGIKDFNVGPKTLKLLEGNTSKGRQTLSELNSSSLR